MSDVRVSHAQFSPAANLVQVAWVQFDTQSSASDVRVSWVQFDTLTAAVRDWLMQARRRGRR